MIEEVELLNPTASLLRDEKHPKQPLSSRHSAQAFNP
jgi:hypothetical protein